MTEAVVSISPDTLLAIMGAAAIAGTIAAILARRGLPVPIVVLELLAGILLGPHVIGLGVSGVTLLFKDLGLGLLFFFAGYEIEPRRIIGKPLRLAMLGWGMSLALAYAFAGILQAAGVVLALLYTGSALATTAIGTLIPMLSDSGELRTRFGTYLLAAGAMGEFGPILLLTLVLSAEGSLRNALILLAFTGVAAIAGLFAIRSSTRTMPLLHGTLTASSQLAVRWVLVLVFGLSLLAYHLGLDLLLGGFAAGLIVREMLRDKPMPEFNSKLTAIGFGVFVPFFFIVSGMSLDISAFATAGGIVRTGLFFVLMLIVRGVPALVLYRHELGTRERRALALMTATQLPLVLAITALATSIGQMRAPVAADLVGAAVLSTLIFPLLGLRILREPAADVAVQPADPTPAHAA